MPTADSASPTLRPIVAALGGDLFAGGRHASVPAPGHSPQDRSVSLLLSGDRVVAHSFGAASWQEVLDDLRARGLIDDQHRITGFTAGRAAPALPLRPERVAAARALWAAGRPLTTRTPAARYSLLRGIGPEAVASPALRAHPAAPASVYRPGRRRFPALLAAAHTVDGALTAVEITYLTLDGLRRTLAVPRKLVGQLPPGAAVRLAHPTGDLLVAEGVFTALSAARLFGLPAWALLGAHNLARWRPPPGVRRVLIAGDRGAVGEAAADRLRAALIQIGVAAEVQLPCPPATDWNEALAALG